MIKIIHSADVHFCRKYKEEALASLRTMRDKGKTEEVDLFVLSGDLTDAAMQNTEADGMPDLIQIIDEMLNLAPIVTVEGTPTHDIKGGYEVFKNRKTLFPFVVLEPGKPYFFNGHGIIENEKNLVEYSMLIFGLPEPQKSWFMANNEAMGREEVTQAIIDGMKSIFLGMGAERKNYPDLPCLFVGHLNVSGATLQNSQLLGQGEISPGFDDLKMIGADYIALGHIHRYQELFKNCFYPGSVYPCNYGETDQKAFNLVTFEGKNTKVEKVNFPHAPLKKIEIDYCQEITEELFTAYSGFKSWVEITCTDDEAKSIDIETWTKSIIERGALPGSKVTIRKIARETVRAQEIQTASHLRDKVKVYAEASSLPEPKDSILEKADLLEKELIQSGGKASEFRYRVNKLRLRGLKGIYKNLKKEEITIDFDKFEPGLIALIGKNGSGKTTTMERINPFPFMITRKGILQDHCFLRDSLSDLYFTDEKTGIKYRSLFNIDGLNKSGKCDYNLFKKENDIFEPLTNGRKEDYENKINELFGSIDLFLKSAFISQKPSKGSPDLSDATKGQRKALFLELAGLEKFQKYSESAKEKKKAIENETLKTQGQVEALKADLEKVEDIKADIVNTSGDIDLLKLDLDRLKKSSMIEKEKLDILEAENIGNREVKSKIEQIHLKTIEYSEKIEENNKRIIQATTSLQNKEAAEKNIMIYDSAVERIRKIESLNQEIRKDREALRAAYDEAFQAVIESETQLTDLIYKVEINIKESYNKYISHQNEKIRAEKEIEKLLNSTKCPTCGQELPEESKAMLNINISVLKDTVRITIDSLELLKTEIDELKKVKKAYEEQKALIKYPDKPEYKKEHDKSEFEKLLTQANVEQSRKIISEAEKAQSIIQEIKLSNDELQRNYEADKAELERLNQIYDSTLLEQLKNQAAKVEQIRIDYGFKQADLRAEEKKLEMLNSQLAELNLKKSKLEDIEETLSYSKQEISDWYYLEKACGADGIQALELDALSPNIESEVNQILKSAYGDRFSIEFQTTRIGGTGKNTKQIEDFLIMVNDNGKTQELSTLSGGEEVLVKKALYDAFGRIRNINTGTDFLTVCMDEADGALDHESKQQYLKMVMYSHIQSKKHHTIIITHDPFIQQQISQKIVMEDLK